MLFACEYCTGFEAAIASLVALPFVFHWVWHKLRKWWFFLHVNMSKLTIDQYKQIKAQYPEELE